jgi:hypothetical protein
MASGWLAGWQQQQQQQQRQRQWEHSHVSGKYSVRQ